MTSIVSPTQATPTPLTPPPLLAQTGLSAVLGRGRFIGPAALLGPAFVAAIAYVDPGNFSTNISAGSQFGYRLVWVVVIANLMAMPVQFLSAKVGIVTGQSLPEVCHGRYRRSVLWGLWLQAELVAMATDLAEFVGAAIGLHLLFGVSPLPAGIITAVAAIAVLGLQRRGYRGFERAIGFLLLVVLGGFAYQLFRAGADVAAVSGLVPGFDSGDEAFLAVGILGATMMPHVVYLHSALTSRRVGCGDDTERRTLLRFERFDVGVALGIAGLINVSMLLVAAKLFHGRAGTSVSTLIEAHQGLVTILGGGAGLAFAAALLASGISSSSVGTYAGQVVMTGFIDRQIPLLLRRLVTMAPALAVLALGVDSTQVLNLSQVVLSFGIPFALIPLLLVTRRRDIMGSFASPRWVTAAMVAITAVVVGLNGFLIWHQLVG